MFRWLICLEPMSIFSIAYQPHHQTISRPQSAPKTNMQIEIPQQLPTTGFQPQFKTTVLYPETFLNSKTIVLMNRML